ncbi:Nitrate regulatory gene2 protein [Glycine max]|nr:Nitrate regulatory gene2 protein [Glycine max]
MCMWRSMYECHQVQKHIVQQLEYLNTIPSKNPTSEIHKQSTLQLELEVQQWHQSFCNLFKAHHDYIQSLTGWLRLTLFQFSKTPINRTPEESKIYTLCEEWHLAVDRIPDKVASEGIKILLTVIHAIALQQAKEQKQKKKSDSTFKELEKKVVQLRSLECKYGPYSMPESSGSLRTRDPITEKRTKVDALKAKADEEKSKYNKSVSVTRAMTLNNLQMGCPHVFQGIVGFSSVCMEVFESVYNKAKASEQEHDNSTISNMGTFSQGNWCWDLKWRRNLFDYEQHTAVTFMEAITDIQIQPHMQDIRVWKADPSGIYSTKSTYRLLRTSNPIPEAKVLYWMLRILD